MPPPRQTGQRVKLGAAKSTGIAVPVAMAFGGAARNTLPYKKAAQAAAVKRQAALKSLTPARSALVRQSGGPHKDLKSLAETLKKARTGASGAVKNVLGNDLKRAKTALGPAKTALAPAKKMAGAEKAGVKDVLGRDKQSALKALAPAKSALVRQKAGLAGQAKRVKKDLTPVGQAAKGLEGGAKTALKGDATAVKNFTAPGRAALKRAGASDKKAALTAMAPAKSALVKERKVVGQNLSGIKSTLGRDLGFLKGGAKKDMGTIGNAAKGSRAAALAKRVGQATHKDLYGTP